ncbi:hypothetical protein ACIQI7_12150 [Kitasatospora sp. NPDC092039]|uniref:hypothetical protein n=1 Tax=unclassified Kitasatospora TaxID=2633591 RepID=UPI0036AE01FA|nr:hypothetical protein KitaXyl93_25330 [Kitasatospora sp. Xyl93]
MEMKIMRFPGRILASVVMAALAVIVVSAAPSVSGSAPTAAVSDAALLPGDPGWA